ncbi:DUF5817 domain-containing protein [Halorussus sp. MSC15.2]|uniref:DUF5817 domain-containing protein n=1 Tax=Halorussus sp. MSC15.2 TaxID=2283638 RepID=UPI0013D23614|nr:DUF5817 domain-containing protein [Halorussus sp. MSC15.2]NEU59241.1 hypothetical protein [Halorussus sp. MSC15.2]
MTYHVVGCSTCTDYWLAEDIRGQATADCPHCGTTHETATLDSKYEGDERAVAAEARAQLVARAADHYDAYRDFKDTHGPYAEQEQEVESGFDLVEWRTDFLSDKAENVLAEYYNLLADDATEIFAEYHNLYADEATDVFDGYHDLYADEAIDAFAEYHDRYAAEVERALSEDPDVDTELDRGTDGSIQVKHETPPVDAVPVTVDKPISRLSRVVIDNDCIQQAILTVLEDLAADYPSHELRTVLEANDLNLSETDLAALATQLHKGSERAALTIIDRLQHVATGRSSTDDAHIIPRLLALSTETPTIAATVTDEFWELRASQRRTVADYLTALSAGTDLVLVGPRLTLRNLHDDQGTRLPVSREDITSAGSHRTETIETAQQALSRDSPEEQVLRWLADQDSETLSYSALDSKLTVSDSRRRQLVGHLRDLCLVDTFGPRTNKHVELLPAGRTYLDWVDEQLARQQTLEASVSGVLDSSDDSRVTPRAHDGGREEAADRTRLPHLHTVQPLPRWNATASAASTPENGVAIVDYPLNPQADRGSPRWYYDYQQDRLTVGAEFDGPLQYWVCIARALASPRTFAAVLDDGDRLDEDDTFSTFLTDHRHILRDSRCLAHLPDAVEDGADYLDELQTAEEHLCELTRDLAHGDFEGSEAEFRSTITREALGLAGTMVHLLDLVDVEVVRQVRLPTQNSGRNDILRDDRRETLVQSLATGIAIQSKYGHAAIYRQLFETRDKKRDAAIVPSVDYDDPFGELIGSVCIVGNLGDRELALAEDLRNRLRMPQELHEDAPEIQVRVPVVATDDLDRTAFAAAVERMCAAKNLSPTRSAVSVLRLFTATPFDAAAAICGLDPESRRRDIRLDEIRYGLAVVGDARILPWETPGVQALVTTLLTAENPLSVTELTDRAGVDRTTWYDHRDRLVALDLVRETSAGVRLALPFRGSGESDVRPWFTRRDTRRDDVRVASVGGVVLELLDELTPDSETIQTVSAALQHPVDIDELQDAWPDLDGWLSTIQIATAETMDSLDDSPEFVVFGRQPDQFSLQVAATGRIQGRGNHASSP